MVIFIVKVSKKYKTNATLTPKDSVGINNPALINELQPGLYKVEKNYNDGSSQETVIVKQNN